jgi:hypothetical protein
VEGVSIGARCTESQSQTLKLRWCCSSDKFGAVDMADKHLKGELTPSSEISYGGHGLGMLLQEGLRARSAVSILGERQGHGETP